VQQAQGVCAMAFKNSFNLIRQKSHSAYTDRCAQVF
jgi:hypothetical protein